MRGCESVSLPLSTAGGLKGQYHANFPCKRGAVYEIGINKRALIRSDMTPSVLLCSESCSSQDRMRFCNMMSLLRMLSDKSAVCAQSLIIIHCRHKAGLDKQALPHDHSHKRCHCARFGDTPML